MLEINNYCIYELESLTDLFTYILGFASLGVVSIAGIFISQYKTIVSMHYIL